MAVATELMSPSREEVTDDDNSTYSASANGSPKWVPNIDTANNNNNSNNNHNGNSHPEYAPPTKEYSFQWQWDANDMDYVRVDEDGNKHYYTEYQKGERSVATREDAEGGNTSPKALVRQSSMPRSPRRRSTQDSNTSIPRSITRSPVQSLPPWAGPLDERFQVVAKPKRFFSVGRIFKTVWFEPGWKEPSRSPTTRDWQEDIEGYFREKPIAKYRWFVVVRRRLHHSVCFSIGTYGGKSSTNPNKAARGRDMDYVVLHKSSVPPARPYPEEKITREPVAVIIEDEEQYISPIARLDCGRIYTVEDNLKVMKVGRVHPASLPTLEQYYKDSVL